MTWLPFDKCLWCLEKSQVIYLEACRLSLLAEPHRLTINDAFADKWFFLCRLANEMGDDVWRQMNTELPNAAIHYNMVRNNKFPQSNPPDPTLNSSVPVCCQWIQCHYSLCFLFSLCSPERSVVEWIFWLRILLRDYAALGTDCGGWESQVGAFLFLKFCPLN